MVQAGFYNLVFFTCRKNTIFAHEWCTFDLVFTEGREEEKEEEEGGVWGGEGTGR